jgi:molybdopterin molybdotransferase
MSRDLHWEEARARVVDGLSPLPPVTVPTANSRGLALAEAVRAPESMPPFDNSGMDGFAVRGEDVIEASEERPRRLEVLGSLPAGSAERFRVGPGQAVRIMTGAPVPEGADAVVPVELTNFWDESAERGRLPRGPDEERVVLVRGTVPAGGNVRRAGESVRRDETFLDAGKRLGGPEVALLLSVGVREITVHPRPVVGVLSTGDELVPPEADPGPGQIRDSSRAGILAALTDYGFPTVDLGLVGDDEEELTRAVVEGAERVDFLLTTGGVSVGDYDFTRRVLDRVGRVEAYRVAVKPGKPQLFGRVGPTPVFGLPGNPVSSLVVLDQFVLPGLKKLAGRADLYRPFFAARLSEAVKRRPGRTEFLRVRLETRDGEWIACSTGPQGSGILSTLTRANGYALLPPEAETISAGTRVLCQLMSRD